MTRVVKISVTGGRVEVAQRRGGRDGRTEPTSDLFAHDLAEKNKTKVQALAGNHLEPSDAPSSPPRPSPLLLLNLDQPQL